MRLAGMPGRRGTGALLLLFLFAAPMMHGCTASTRYIPPPDGRAYIGLSKNKLTVIRDGVEAPLPRGIAPLLWTDAITQDLGQRATTSFRRAEATATVATLMMTLLPITLPFAMPLLIDSGAQARTGAALMVDAVNSHNDRCQGEAKP